MAAKTNMELYDDIYRKHPELFEKIKKEISHELEYEFVKESLIKGYGTMEQGRYRCVDYAKIIPRIKYPEEYLNLKDKLERAKANEVENPIAFLIVGTVIHIEKNDEGRYTVVITDDERLWNNPDNYDCLVHLNSVRQVVHCIIANEFFNLSGSNSPQLCCVTNFFK